MTSEKHKTQSETVELHEKIAALDAELTEDFKAQFKKIKTNPPINRRK